MNIEGKEKMKAVSSEKTSIFKYIIRYFILSILLLTCMVNFVSCRKKETKTNKNTTSLEDFVIDKDNKLYSMSGLFPEDMDIITASMFDNENIVFLGEEKSGEGKLEICKLSLDTMEVSVETELMVEENEDSIGLYNYEIKSSNPYIFMDYNSMSYYFLNTDFDKQIVLKLSQQDPSENFVYSEFDDKLYMSNSNSQKVYSLDYNSLFDINKTEISMEDICEIRELVWTPDVNLGNCSLAGISENGIIKISGQDLVSETYITLLYNISTKDYDKIYSDDSSQTYYYMAADNTWAYDEVGGTVDFYDFINKECYECNLDLSRYEEDISSDDNQDKNEIDNHNNAIDEDSKDDTNYTLANESKDSIDENSLEADGTDENSPEADGIDEENDEEEFEGEEDFTGIPYVVSNMECICEDGIILLPVLKDGDSGLCDVLVWKYGENNSKKEAEIPKYTDFELQIEQDYGEITKTANELENKYDIQIIIAGNVQNQYPAYTSKMENNADAISSALKELDRAFSIYPEGFIDELCGDWTTSINIYFSGTLVPEDPDVNISNAAAATSSEGGYQMIVLDINDGAPVSQTLVHEMTHVIDNCMENDGYLEDLDKKWAACNPDGFDYYNSYFGYEGDYENTTFTDEYWNGNPEDVYFYDDYAKTFSTEDRARLMEHFYDPDNIEDCYKSPHVIEKLTIYMDFLKKHFKSFEDFDSSVWGKMYNSIK